ncbi:hypothetical protein [Emticicia sp. W12TSBA100-4]|uniref:hypothetical protein n=1 Tax=Emticicia sp. W12TSBA100-4 TaxID=3160965 RepID=UPI0033067DB2
MNLEEAEEYGALLFTEKEVKLILTKEANTVENAILKGQLLTEATIRKVIIEQAKNGSSEAQKIVLKWQNAIKVSKIR